VCQKSPTRVSKESYLLSERLKGSLACQGLDTRVPLPPPPPPRLSDVGCRVWGVGYIDLGFRALGLV
jgi:hypothetical protein